MVKESLPMAGDLELDGLQSFFQRKPFYDSVILLKIYIILKQKWFILFVMNGNASFLLSEINKNALQSWLWLFKEYLILITISTQNYHRKKNPMNFLLKKPTTNLQPSL